MAKKANVIIVDHPLGQRALTLLRDKKTTTAHFRSALQDAGELLCLATLHDLKTKPVKVLTPLRPCAGVVCHEPVLLVPVLRAGLGLVSPFLRWLPEAVVGHLGLARDEKTLQPHSYYVKLPTITASHRVILLDPMLATGGSAVAALTELKKNGAKKLTLVCLVAAPEGIAAVQRQFPSVPIYTCAVDAKLNSRGYIVPGLGDAGDRLCGTV
jgi:uracil phosphoribosyltransferase